MACFPVPLLAWLPWCLQQVISPLDNDGWDYGGNQKAPPDMVAEDAVRPHASALHQASSGRNSHPQQVQGNFSKDIPGEILNSVELISRAELNQPFYPRDDDTLPDIQPPQEAARRSFSIREPTSIKFLRLFTRQRDGFDKSPPLPPSHQSGIETNTQQSFRASVFEGSIRIRSMCNYLYAEPFLQIMPIIPPLPIRLDLL